MYSTVFNLVQKARAERSSFSQNIVIMQVEYGVWFEFIQKMSFLRSICKKNELNRLRNDEIREDLRGRIEGLFV